MARKWNMVANPEVLLEAPNSETLSLLDVLKRVYAEHEAKFKAAEERCYERWIDSGIHAKERPGSPYWYLGSRVIFADIIEMLKRSVSGP